MNLTEIFKSFTTLKLLVVGDIMVDHKVDGCVTRISPEAPVPVFNKLKDSFTLGGAGNLARNLRTLGAQVTLTAVLGKDEFANSVQDLCMQQAINLIAVQDREFTTVKTRYFCGNHYMFRSDAEQTQLISAQVAQQLLHSIHNSNYDAIIISDYAKGVVTNDFMEGIKKMHLPILGDPRPVNVELYNSTQYITPNVAELVQIAHHYGINASNNNTDQNIHTILLALSKKLQTTVVVTRSEKGISYLQQDQLITIPTHVVEVYDVTGAGDSAMASFAAAIAAKIPLHQAATLANAAGGAAVRKVGVVAVTPQMITEVMQEQPVKIA